MSTFRLVETQPNDVIVTVNRIALLKFIGWCEANRPSADYEPSFLGRCLTDLECASEGHPLDATAECGWCGLTCSLVNADEHLYRDGDWYCKNRDECDERSAVTCAGCGAKYNPSDPKVSYDSDTSGWFCKDSTACEQRRIGGETR